MFDIKNIKIKWWENILLFFVKGKTKYCFDEEIYEIKYKQMLGKTYILNDFFEK